jgi:hypothetical protein
MLNTKWTTFHTSVRDYRKMLDTSIDYYHNVEEVSRPSVNQIYIDIASTIYIYLVDTRTKTSVFLPKKMTSSQSEVEDNKLAIVQITCQ